MLSTFGVCLGKDNFMLAVQSIWLTLHEIFHNCDWLTAEKATKNSCDSNRARHETNTREPSWKAISTVRQNSSLTKMIRQRRSNCVKIPFVSSFNSFQWISFQKVLDRFVDFSPLCRYHTCHTTMWKAESFGGKLRALALNKSLRGLLVLQKSRFNHGHFISSHQNFKNRFVVVVLISKMLDSIVVYTLGHLGLWPWQDQNQGLRLPLPRHLPLPPLLLHRRSPPLQELLLKMV